MRQCCATHWTHCCSLKPPPFSSRRHTAAERCVRRMRAADDPRRDNMGALRPRPARPLRRSRSARRVRHLVRLQPVPRRPRAAARRRRSRSARRARAAGCSVSACNRAGARSLQPTFDSGPRVVEPRPPPACCGTAEAKPERNARSTLRRDGSGSVATAARSVRDCPERVEHAVEQRRPPAGCGTAERGE
jgi:hypothetical protein